MSNTAVETANILSDLYSENFACQTNEPYRITWPQLRSIAGISKLTDEYIGSISSELAKSEIILVPCSRFFLVGLERDFNEFRMVTDKIVEQYLLDDEELFEDSIPNEDIEV